MAVQKQLELYSESTLKDIYKSFFQDEFGPGHLLENPEKTRIYFEQELKSMKSRRRCYAEPCGRGRNFYRVPMDLIIDGSVSAEVYFSNFHSGASEFILPDMDKWKKKWSIIFRILQGHRDLIKNFERDSLEIHEVLKNGHYVIHHSRRYRELYNPHYRIFSVHC